MNITRKEREELKELSRKVYGKTSKWSTLLRKGELVPKIDHATGLTVKYQKHFTLEEVRSNMEKILSDIKETQDKAAEKRLADQAKEEKT